MITGMTMSRSWMMIHTSTPAAAITTRKRHAQAAAVRMPGETASSPAGGGATGFGRQNIPSVYEALMGAGCRMLTPAYTPLRTRRPRPVGR
ncbi:hypothetical protein GCM10009766_18500 [Microcella frigidaquae]